MYLNMIPMSKPIIADRITAFLIFLVSQGYALVSYGKIVQIIGYSIVDRLTHTVLLNNSPN